MQLRLFFRIHFYRIFLNIFMKYLIAFFTILILVSCSESKEQEKFLNVYREILIARDSYLDSIKASKEILKIYTKYGFTAETFKKKYFEYAANHQEFIRMIDSLRQQITREMSIKKSRTQKKDGNKE
ncbi:MAG: hypothetical protein HW421_519 [Ignavibacteria bacterium]|nr:hypothetical protein [Ignavibacteria bacterium]